MVNDLLDDSDVVFGTVSRETVSPYTEESEHCTVLLMWTNCRLKTITVVF